MILLAATDGTVDHLALFSNYGLISKGTHLNLKPIPVARFLVVGVVRNCEKTLERDIRRLRSALCEAAYVENFVVESDSSDSTVGVLQKLSHELPNFSYKTLGALSGSIAKRTARLAFCRNIYVEYARNSLGKSRFDYVIVADLDGVNNEISAEAIESCWMRDDWDACFANQRGPYYDIWALRHPFWSPNDCWAQERFYRGATKSNVFSAFVSVYARQIEISEDSDWIEVESAYGGLGIYRAEVFTRRGTHVGLDDAGNEICDIPPFHQSIKFPNTKFFINPRLINGSNNEHTFRLMIPRVIKLVFRLSWYLISRGTRFRL